MGVFSLSRNPGHFHDLGFFYAQQNGKKKELGHRCCYLLIFSQHNMISDTTAVIWLEEGYILCFSSS